MIIAGITFLLLTASAVSLYLRYRGVRLAYIWIIFVISILAVWLFMVIVQPATISPLVLKNWIKIGSSPVNLTLEINDLNWPICVSYFAILLSYILTSIVRVRGNESVFTWVEMTILVVCGWLILLAGDYWSLLITWTLIDFVEMFFHIRYRILDPDRFFIHFLIKFIGSMLLVLGISRSFQANPQGLFKNNIAEIESIILLSAILHSGVFSDIQKKPYKMNYSQVSLIFLRIISFTASFFVLTFITDHQISFLSELISKIIFLCISIWGAYKWAMGLDENYGIQKLLLAFGGMIGYLFLSGAEGAIVIWLILLIMPIGWLFIYSDRSPRTYVFWILCIFMMSGLPFSLTFLGFTEFLNSSNLFDIFLLILPMVLLISGFIKHAMKERGKFNYIESWYQVFYQFGLFLPIISMGAVIYKNISFLLSEIRRLWIGVLILALSVTIYFFQINKKEQINILEIDRELSVGGISISLQTIQSITEKIYILLEKILAFISRLFEGAGGILWAVVFLALFLTILKFQGGGIK